MRNTLTQEEIDDLAKEYLRLRDKAGKSKSNRVKAKFANFQNHIVRKLEPLITMRTNKYRKFSNHTDLTQDGFEALILALKTFNPDKGSFAGWAHRYIATRVSRAANAHSTIRYPLKKAKELQPYKISTMPVMLDQRDPEKYVEGYEKKDIVMAAINSLPDNQKRVMLLKHEMAGSRSPTSVSGISQELSISRPTCVKLIEEAEESLRHRLQTLVE